eukprot:1352849-Amorphochlora_amoeboformis.AAC.1
MEPLEIENATTEEKSQKKASSKMRNCCCFRSIAGWPVFVFIHGIIFITIIYGAYTAWAIGCWVGLKVSSRSWYVTVVAILTDFVVLVMFAWGVYLASNREEKCSQVYSTQAPT